MYAVAGDLRFLCVINGMDYLLPHPAILFFSNFGDTLKTWKYFFLNNPWRIGRAKNIRE